MPTFEVVSGDTVWGLTRRALTEQLGRVPTNREILEVVNQVQVPSGNVDLIFPGEQITIPVGPGYGPERGREDVPGMGTPPGSFISNPPASQPAPGFNRVPPAVNAPPGGRPDDWQNPYRPGGSPGGAQNAPAGGRMSESEIAAAAGEQFIDPYAAYRSQIRPAPLELDKYPESTYALGGLTAAALAGAGLTGLLGRGATGAATRVAPRGPAALPSGARPALPAGPVRPALPAGPRPALPAGPGPVARAPSGAIPLGPGAPAAPFRYPAPQFGDAWGRYGTGYMF